LRIKAKALNLKSYSLTCAPFALSAFPGSLTMASHSAGHNAPAKTELI
jgi:hypothetical protein